MARVRVAVFDEDASFRAGLVSQLESIPELEVVGETGEANVVLELLVHQRPDVLLLDLHTLSIYIGDFIQLIRDLPSGKHCRLVVLARSCYERGLVKAFTIGASGYLLKNSSPDEIRKTVLTVFENPTASSLLPFPRIKKITETAEMEPDEICLSPREMEVLACLSQAMTSLQIADHFFISENTVKTHVRHILIKLSVSSRREAVEKAAQLGLI